MCTAVLSIEPGLPTLMVGVRDELTNRAWSRPASHWPTYPGLIGGQDMVAGGTWLAVALHERRVACVLNGRGKLAPTRSRRSRGDLPLRAASGEPLPRSGFAEYDPFHLITAEPGGGIMQSWDGERFTELELGPGLHFVVNSGLAEHGDQPADEAGESPGPADALAANGRTNELARIARFRPLFAAADRPAPQPGKPVARAWGGWLALADGDGLDPGDTRALVVRREMGAGRIWGTTSVSLVAVSAGAVRYDFTGSPGDPAAWYPVIGGPAADLT